MEIEFVTASELESFRIKLLEDILKLIKENTNTPLNEWLKSHEVMEILGVSPGTLQNLRNNGTLPFSKIGGILFYASADIQELLERNKNCPDR